MATVGTSSFLLIFLLTETVAGCDAFTLIALLFWIKGRLLTRLEKFYLASSLPIREISEFTNCLSALKGLM